MCLCLIWHSLFKRYGRSLKEIIIVWTKKVLILKTLAWNSTAQNKFVVESSFSALLTLFKLIHAETQCVTNRYQKCNNIQMLNFTYTLSRKEIDISWQTFEMV